MTIPRGVAVVVLAVAAGLAVSQPALEAQRPTFASGVEMVPLTVTVTDGSGRLTTGLNASDFAVFEDGIEQTLSLFIDEPMAADVAFVVDTSSSMAAALPLVKTAIHGLVETLRQDDRAAIVEIKQSILMPQALTADRGALRVAIDAVKASGTTALYDGVYTALRNFERERRGEDGMRRQVMVLLSDGFDTASHVGFDATNDLARRLGVSIYTIALKSTLVPSGAGARRSPAEMDAAYAMRALATDAGGKAFSPASAAELPGIYRTIGQELAFQYRLGYMPTRPGNGEFRRISVRILPPTRATARTRSGYVAARATPAGAARTAREIYD